MKSRRRVNSTVGRHSPSRTDMKHTTILVILFGLLTSSAVGQYRRIVSSDGFVQRGKVKIPSASSSWSVNEESVRHTEEYYDSPQIARYILGRLRGTMRPASKIAPNAGAL